ncbi:MAG: hypothetical protein L6R39_000454 [Caloplaca ligustica]|nr:MAG: hypothetical protein L6R39_000454 [Caloplaca ligustica]
MAGRSGQLDTSAAERIAQLNSVDKDVAKLLHYAGNAIKTLTVHAPESEGSQGNHAQDIEQRKAGFAAASSEYFTLLASIDVRLRRHITDLEIAGILPSEAVTQDFRPTQIEQNHQKPPINPKNTVTNGGLGNLDIGWLNSRNDNIEKTMEAELWKESQKLVEKTLQTRSASQNDNDVSMLDDPAATAG